MSTAAGELNHVELYVSDLVRSKAFWSWFLGLLGWAPYQEWPQGSSWKLGVTYLVLVQTEEKHLDVAYNRCRVGLNHLAFHAASPKQVDQVTALLRERGTAILYEDRHPRAGGQDTCAVFFEDPDRIKVELVAPAPKPASKLDAIVVRELPTGKAATCERILRALPAWFGIESSILDYVRAVEAMPTWVAEVGDEPVGFLALEPKNQHVAEVHVMGVLPGHHGRGIGTRLLDAADEWLREHAVEILEVKTLGPSREDANYAKTRAFYLARGFRPVEEFQGVWAPGNPCLVMVRVVPGRQAAKSEPSKHA